MGTLPSIQSSLAVFLISSFIRRPDARDHSTRKIHRAGRKVQPQGSINPSCAAVLFRTSESLISSHQAQLDLSKYLAIHDVQLEPKTATLYQLLK
jgi:hypothetical protein